MDAIASRRRTLFTAAGAIVLGGGITAGAAASVADLVEQPDTELIIACGRFCELEREFDAACLIDDEAGIDVHTRPIVATSDALVERMITMPCTSLAGVQALARALAAWDRELLTDAPAEDMGELLKSHLVARLLALPSKGA